MPLNSGSAITPESYAEALLSTLGINRPVPGHRGLAAPMMWADSGAMQLSGYADGPPRHCAAPLAVCAQGVWLALSALCPDAFAPDFRAYRLLGERAALANLQRQGRVSAGGACGFYTLADGVLALNLAREDDATLLPAWLECDVSALSELPALLATRDSATLMERGRLLGLAVAALNKPGVAQSWYQARRFAAPIKPRGEVPVVVDLSALWAGPLCGQLLAQSGARVIKVESSRRPDGARLGPSDFFDVMNVGKESVALDFRDSRDLQRLRGLLEKADIVIESARPRALEQLGIDAEEILASYPGKIWLSITGYGRNAPMREWIAYGDDAGVAAGLSWLMGGDVGDPVFCADAIADPLTGLHAALLALAGWRSGGGTLLDIALHDVVAHCIAAGHLDADPALSQDGVVKPVARVAAGRAASMGADTSTVLREFAL